MRTSRVALAFLLVAPFASAQPPEPATVRIGVLSLFHPQTLVLTASNPIAIHIDSGTSILPGGEPLTLHSTPAGVVVELTNVNPVSTRILAIPATTFTLTVPGKLTRTYRGAFTLTVRADTLVPVITIDTETAVASIVAAESPPHAPLEALKAQAVAARSYLLANLASNAPAHRGFDACDTTHCQFLRSPPPPFTLAAIATRATRNLVLTWRPEPGAAPALVYAMYSRSCGGNTRPHPTTPGAYPFYAVRCDFCRRHPETFDPLSPGHGIGLCQVGAEELARRGAVFSQILSHFYPNATLAELP